MIARARLASKQGNPARPGPARPARFNQARTGRVRPAKPGPGPDHVGTVLVRPDHARPSRAGVLLGNAKPGPDHAS